MTVAAEKGTKHKNEKNDRGIENVEMSAVCKVARFTAGTNIVQRFTIVKEFFDKSQQTTTKTPCLE